MTVTVTGRKRRRMPVVVHQQPVQKAKVRQLMPWLMVRMLWLGLTPEALELRLLLMRSGGRAAGED